MRKGKYGITALCLVLLCTAAVAPGIAQEDAVLKNMLVNALTTTLHTAAMQGNVEKTRALLAKGHDVNGLDKNGTTPLFWAAFSEDLAVARVLVEHGADVNAVGPTGATPLYNALHKRNEKLALWLLDQGANGLAADNNRNTMLHLASLTSLLPVVDRLLAQGADVNALNANGQSPLTVNLILQLRLPPISASAACLLRLLEAGAAYDPVPWLDMPLLDVLVERAPSGSPFRADLQNFVLRTDKATLRDLVQKALARAKNTSVFDVMDADESELLRYTAQDRKAKTLRSSVLGDMLRDEYDFWRSQAVAVPLYNNEAVAVAYYDVDLDDAPAWIAEADTAMQAFLKLDEAFRLSLSERVAEFARINLDAWDYSGYEAKEEAPRLGLRDLSIDAAWLDDFVAGKRKPEDVWRMVGKPTEILVARHSGDKAMYVVMSWDCLWDAEHGLQLSFKEGRSLPRISARDGDLTD